MEEYLEEMAVEMEKPLKHLRSELTKVRTGRASLAVLDDIKVEYYGSPTPLSGVASLSVPEPRMIIVKPWDPSMLATLERAITASSLGINPNNDGKIIRLIFPELTGDRRKELSRQIAERGEHAKVVVRNVRRDYNDLFKGSQKDGDVGEDELKRYLDKIQETTDQWCTRIDEVVQSKETEILEG
jgi:ribosome recycling factor